jgi:Zn-dependent protease with chaperone function
MNRIKTAMLLATLTALLVWAGHALAGPGGLWVALAFAGLMNFGAYWWSDTLVLRMYGAQEVTEAQAPSLYAIVRTLALRGELPMPRVYVIPEPAPNAFATGRSPRHAAVAVTDGLMRLLDREELAGVLGHELGHVKRRDTLTMTVAAAIKLTHPRAVRGCRSALVGRPGRPAALERARVRPGSRWPHLCAGTTVRVGRAVQTSLCVGRPGIGRRDAGCPTRPQD